MSWHPRSWVHSMQRYEKLERSFLNCEEKSPRVRVRAPECLARLGDTERQRKWTASSDWARRSLEGECYTVMRRVYIGCASRVFLEAFSLHILRGMGIGVRIHGLGWKEIIDRRIGRSGGWREKNFGRALELVG